MQHKLDGKSTILWILSYMCLGGFFLGIATIPQDNQEILEDRIPFLLGSIFLWIVFIWLSLVAIYRKQKKSRFNFINKISKKTSGEEVFGLNVLLFWSIVMLIQFARVLFA